MDFASMRKVSPCSSLLLAPLVLVLSGCATAPIEPQWDPVPCPADCRIKIELPSFDRTARLPHDRMIVIVDGGSRITFEIESRGNAEESRTRLVAKAAIFIDKDGELVDFIELSEGSKDVEIATFEQCDQKYHERLGRDVVCKVKYDVRNWGNSRSRDFDPWIIIRR